jgi:AcrR family transcriptional regulator
MGGEAQSGPSGKRLTQDERRERSERRMLAAAIELFARQGSGRTTLVEIGQLSGYTHGLVSHRFGSKTGLVRQLLKNLQRDFTTKQLPEATERGEGLEALLEVVSGTLSLMTEGAKSARSIRALTVLMAEALGPVPELLDDAIALNRSFRAVLRKLLEQGVEAGEIRKDVHPDERAAAIVAQIRGVELLWSLDPRSISLQSLIAEIVDSLRRSLQAQSAG